jgi:ABC-type phosphate/phosphonate transport system substrate-binding protein
MTRRTPALASVVAALCLGVWTVAARAQASDGRETLKVAFTSAMFAAVNINDAKAAISVWAETLAGAHGLKIKTSTSVYEDIDELGRAMDAGRVNLAALSVAQYRRLGRPRFGTVLLGGRRGRFAEEFLLLVKKGGPTSLAALKGRTLTTVEGFSLDMSMAWLESALLDAGLGPASAHFGTITRVGKPARAVLPVFFGQQDACLTSRYGYELMVELNPQIGSVLTAVTVSPALLHAIMVFDHQFSPDDRPAVLRALLSLQDTPRGQQVMSVFGIERLVQGSPADLVPSLDLLARLERLRPAVKAR